MTSSVRSQAALARVRVAKIFVAARDPTSWRFVSRGFTHRVFPSFEHAGISFPHDAYQTVFDVGMSRGQFALFALWRFPDARLISFEPLPESAAIAREMLPADRVTIHPVALGAVREQAPFYVSAQHDSSSLLPIGSTQVGHFPGTQEERQTTVQVETLDAFLVSDATCPPCLLKIDVQGAELEVLKGAGQALDLVDDLLVEASFVELYDGQALAHEVIAYVGAHGFRLADVVHSSRDSQGRAIQADFLFTRGANH